jgi:hypothetical protein
MGNMKVTFKKQGKITSMMNLFRSEPRLADFHRPFEGEETSAISDIFSIQGPVL